MTNFDAYPEVMANQPQQRVRMMQELESWVKWMPDWALWSFAHLRPLIKQAKRLSEEDEKKLWNLYKATSFNKSKGIIPKSEDRPFKKKEKSWVQD